MVWVNIIAVIILFFSFLGGLKEGAVKKFFSLVAVLIAIPLTGLSYRLLASLFSFLPGDNWENFIGFYITMSLIILILYFSFLIPRRLIQVFWKKGVIFRLVGGAFTILNTAIDIVVFALVIGAYPIFGWLQKAVTGSVILDWLISNLSFVEKMLPFA
ncbi:CvpA family protein [Chloroflexota bacterium]